MRDDYLHAAYANSSVKQADHDLHLTTPSKVKNIQGVPRNMTVGE